jgi:hypothetical protein
MSANMEEYERIQGEILKFLFDNAKPTQFEEISILTKKPKSETEYHLDVLKGKGFIGVRQIILGNQAVRVFEITALGRKTIMEG